MYIKLHISELLVPTVKEILDGADVLYGTSNYKGPNNVKVVVFNMEFSLISSDITKLRITQPWGLFGDETEVVIPTKFIELYLIQSVE